MQRYHLDTFIEHYTPTDNKYWQFFYDTMYSLPPLDIKDGPWLAGGSIRRLIDHNNKASDFDLFFKNEEQLQTFKSSMPFFKAEYENDLNISLTLSNGAKIQLIKLYFDSVEKLLEEFDFTLCQFATDRLTLVVGDYTLFDVGRRVCSPNKITYPASSMRRMLKYANQGYSICDGTINAIMASCVVPIISEDPAVQDAFEQHESQRLGVRNID